MSGEVGSKFAGTWKLDSSENFDEYMKAVEVGFMMRKLGAVAKPTVVIEINGNTWSLRSETSLSTNENKFELGVEFDETTPDGRKLKSTFSLDGQDKLVQQQTSGGVPSTITRELLDEGKTMKAVCVAKDVTCTRIYKRAE